MSICKDRGHHGTWTKVPSEDFSTCRDCKRTTLEVNPHEGAHERAMAHRTANAGKQMSEHKLTERLAMMALKG